jgi:ABC-type Fe3+-hydroxamate transport system substrate-binding protein
LKRFGLALSLVLLLSLTLSACGATATPVSTTAPTVIPSTVRATTVPAVTTAPNTATVSTTAATTAQFPLTISDSIGNKLTLAKPAERIACLTIECVDILKELGLTPLATQFTLFEMASIFNLNRLYGDKAKNIGQLRPNGFQYDLEQLAQLKPDMNPGNRTANTA